MRKRVSFMDEAIKAIGGDSEAALTVVMTFDRDKLPLELFKCFWDMCLRLVKRSQATLEKRYGRQEGDEASPA